MTLHRATAVLRRGTGEHLVFGYAFHIERCVWFFVPDLGAPESLFGKRATIVFERGNGSRAGAPTKARVVRRATVARMVEALQQMLEGL